MIKADEARKVTAEAQEAKKKKMSLEEARRLEKLFQARMKDADNEVRAAMKRGQSESSFHWSMEDYPQGLRDRFEAQIRDAGYAITVVPGDEGEGWDLCITWGQQ